VRDKEFEVVVWGASGFTGRLVAEHLLTTYGTAGALRWAMAGRDRGKLEAVRSDLGAGDIPILIGDSHDETSLREIAERTRVVCSTVGPYLKYGEPLVAVCAQSGTDYCDLTGESLFIRRMIDRYEAAARASGARICNCCGFDSLPSDLGTLFIQQQFHQRHGHYAERVKCRVKRIKGAMSGGTIDSMINIVNAVKADPAIRRIMFDPYALNPAGDPPGPDGRDQTGAIFDEDFGAWTAPFIMAGINTRVVRRSNAVMGYPWGRDFRYSEAVLTGTGLRGRIRATLTGVGLLAFLFGVSKRASRWLMFKLFLPKPGEGPDEASRLAGFFKFALLATDSKGNALRGAVTGERDPGYGATSRMLGEAAVCMARDLADDVAGGFLTPAALLDGALIERLTASAGIEFRVTD
jgi:short subunit dehydrogenase-like uncharacterized protein